MIYFTAALIKKHLSESKHKNKKQKSHKVFVNERSTQPVKQQGDRRNYLLMTQQNQNINSLSNKKFNSQSGKPVYSLDRDVLLTQIKQENKRMISQKGKNRTSAKHLRLKLKSFENQLKIKKKKQLSRDAKSPLKQITQKKVNRKIFTSPEGKHPLRKLQKSLCKDKNRKQQLSMSRFTNTTDLENKLLVLEKVGQGTFGEIFKCKLGSQIVALKKIYQDKRYIDRQLELLSIMHSNFIVQMKSSFLTEQKCQVTGQKKSYLNIIMDYYQNSFLELILAQHEQPLVDLEIKLYIYQLFRGLHYIHSQNICHRDIKPSNILVDQMRKRLVICDFGSAKKLKKGEMNTAYICSRCYRAPQLILGSSQYTTMTDIWSAGCVILQTLCGHPFFAANSNSLQFYQIAKILGIPTSSEMFNMTGRYVQFQDQNLNEFKKKSWKEILSKQNEDLVSLISQIMIYSPKERLNAAEALAHEYFDDIRQQQVYGELVSLHNIPSLFEFSKEQLKGKEHLIDKLIPEWYQSKHF